ncbi:MAG: sulfite exporter TauE/SafE family protein, partial [Candidatus Micrarchaeota archaeon]
HCIAMCGGFVLSYSLKQKSNSFIPHLSYGAGKLISYTVIGALFGLIGSAVAFTREMRIIAAFIAGAFLILYGFGMLNLLPRFASGLNLSWISKIRSYLASKGPFATGIATGFFIACGPLQAMYVLAAGSGDIAFGAFSLFFFGLGTLPVLLGFSYVSSMISRATANRITQYSGVIVILLGFFMVNNALALSGAQLISTTPETDAVESQLISDSKSLPSGVSSENVEEQVIRMKVNRYGFQPNSFVLRKDVPVKWIIDGEEINGCNNEIIVREYGLDIPVSRGEQIIEFTPNREGTVSWSCWMGMIQGRFIVVDNELPDGAEQLINDEPEIVNTGSSCGVGTGGSCGGSGCGCGCGGR